MQDYLLHEHNIYMLVLEEKNSGMIYTRLSAQIYLEMADFAKLGALVAQYTAGNTSLTRNKTEDQASW